MTPLRSALLAPFRVVVRLMISIDRVDGPLGAIGIVFFPVLLLYFVSLIVDGLTLLGASGLALSVVFILLASLVLMSAMTAIPLMSLRSRIMFNRKSKPINAAQRGASEKAKEWLISFARKL